MWVQWLVIKALIWKAYTYDTDKNCLLSSTTWGFEIITVLQHRIKKKPEGNSGQVLFLLLWKRLLVTERLEKGGPCPCKWGLIEYKWKGYFLGGFVRLFAPVQEIFVLPLAALVGPVKNIFSHRTLLQFICPHRPACWAGSRAGSPVSWYSMCLWLVMYTLYTL